jgi:hypothetical protein
MFSAHRRSVPMSPTRGAAEPTTDIAFLRAGDVGRRVAETADVRELSEGLGLARSG